MKNIFNANILLIALFSLFASSFILFMNKDKFIHTKSITNHILTKYTTDRITMLNEFNKINSNILNCNHENYRFLDSKNTIKEIYFPYETFSFAFSCKKKSFFLVEPTKKKYIQLDKQLNLNWHDIYYINSLSELPQNSINDPKIVFAKQDIDDTLKHPFYGIIITHHYFDIKGEYKIYGQVYSSYDNNREERNLSYDSNVIENIKNNTTYWEYIPNTKRIIANETAL